MGLFHFECEACGHSEAGVLVLPHSPMPTVCPACQAPRWTRQFGGRPKIVIRGTTYLDDGNDLTGEKPMIYRDFGAKLRGKRTHVRSIGESKT